MNASAGTSWAQTRQTLRQLENATRSEFNTLSQYASSSTLSLEPSEGETAAKERLQRLIKERRECLDRLENSLNSDGPAASSAVKQGNLHTHSSRLTTDQQEQLRIQHKIDSERRKASHLTSVHNTIGGPMDEETRRLLNEQTRLDNSENMMTNMISQAIATRGQILTQNATLNDVARRLTVAVGTVPGMNALMAKISSRQRRNGVILGSFMAMCFLFFFFLG